VPAELENGEVLSPFLEIIGRGKYKVHCRSIFLTFVNFYWKHMTQTWVIAVIDLGNAPSLQNKTPILSNAKL
jgi:hypothetical protein